MAANDEALNLARDFERDGFSMPDLYERFWRLQGDETAYFTLADSLLRGRRDGRTLLKDALGYVGKEDFKALITTAVEILREEAAEGRETQQDESAAQTGENARSARADESASKNARQRGRDEKSSRWKNAEEVIIMASLEFAPFLHPYLGELFKLQPNESAYYAEYPWRGLSYESSQIWRERLADPQTSRDERQKIFSCLLQTREPRNVKFACEFALAEDFFDRPCDLLEYIGYWLEAVGFAFERVKFDADEPCTDKSQKAPNDEICFGGEKFRLKRYCSQRVYHIIFPRGYFGAPYAAHLAKHHPTWRFEGGEAGYKLGGVLDEADGDAQNPLFHLITLDPVPRELPVRSLPSLTLAAHVREISEGETAFYEHDRLGKPKRIGERSQIEYVDDEPARQGVVRLRVAPKRWRKQDWALSNGRQNISRIGGEPSWIQGAQVPTCPICGEKMEFLMQLDSGLPSGEDGELLFGSGGILYVFWCERSRVSAFFMQCT